MTAAPASTSLPPPAGGSASVSVTVLPEILTLPDRNARTTPPSVTPKSPAAGTEPPSSGLSNVTVSLERLTTASVTCGRSVTFSAENALKSAVSPPPSSARSRSPDAGAA